MALALDPNFLRCLLYIQNSDLISPRLLKQKLENMLFNDNLVSISSVIDREDKNKRLTLANVVSYSKMYVQVIEVKDFPPIC